MEEGQGQILAEIRRHVQEAFPRVGLDGSLEVEGTELVARVGGAPLRVDATAVASAWSALDEQHKEQQALSLARQLAGMRRQDTAAPVSDPPLRIGISPWVVVVPLLLVGAGALHLFNRSREASTPHPAPSAPAARLTSSASASKPALETREQRALRTCLNTAKRVARGATVGVMDAEGWLVEAGYAAATGTAADLGGLLVLDDAGREGTVVWTDAPDIVAQQSSATRVLVRTVRAADGMPELHVEFSGRYALPYFTKIQRIQFIRLARAIAERLGARQAGLYARCSGAEQRYIGAWFYGATLRDVPSAIVRFLYPAAVAPIERAGAGGSIAVAPLLERVPPALTRAQLLDWVGAAGGMVSGTEAGPSSVIFPFSDASRGSRAAQIVWDKLSQLPE